MFHHFLSTDNVISLPLNFQAVVIFIYSFFLYKPGKFNSKYFKCMVYACTTNINSLLPLYICFLRRKKKLKTFFFCTICLPLTFLLWNCWGQSPGNQGHLPVLATMEALPHPDKGLGSGSFQLQNNTMKERFSYSRIEGAEYQHNWKKKNPKLNLYHYMKVFSFIL
jgi:hypothetical protein